MWIAVPDPVFAIAGGDIIVVIFVVLSILGWLTNIVAGKRKPPPPVRGQQPQRPAPARDDRLSSEIEIFLEQVTGKKRAKPVPRASAPRTEQQRRPQRKRSQEAPRQAKPRSDEQPRREREQRKPKTADRTLDESKKLGSGVRSHLAEHMEEGLVVQEVEQHLTHDVNQSVREHLGAFDVDTSTGGTTRSSSEAVKQVVRMLRNPVTVRQAILISEILSPPKGSRRRS